MSEPRKEYQFDYNQAQPNRFAPDSSWGDSMKQGIYVASKTKHAHIWLRLRAEGYPIISTWIDEAGPGESKCLRDLWMRCVAEAASCKALLLYAEPEDALKGAWVEVGAALACDIPVFAVGIQGLYSVANHPRVICVASIEDALAYAERVCNLKRITPELPRNPDPTPPNERTYR